eukprot:UN10575
MISLFLYFGVFSSIIGLIAGLSPLSILARLSENVGNRSGKLLVFLLLFN